MSISSQQTERKTQLNLQKLVLYISVSDNDFPIISSVQESSTKLATEMRMYFNDEQLTIREDKYKGESYLASGQFQERIGELFEEFVYSVEERESGCGFLEFLEYWVKNQSGLRIQYQVYDEVLTNCVDKYLENLFRVVSRSVMISEKGHKQKEHKSPKIQQTKNNKLLTNKTNIANNKNNCEHSDSKIEISKTSINLTHQKHTKPPTYDQPQDSFNYYLKRFYEHYSKKSANTIKTQQFQKLQHFYTTLNLTKFMTYCKQIELLKAHKSISVKYIQQLFIKNQDERKVMDYERFLKVVGEILLKVFMERQMVESEGYLLIGVKSRENFVEKMRQIGVCVPLKKVIFSKPKDSVNKQLEAQIAVRIRRQAQMQAKVIEQEKENNTKKEKVIKNGGYDYSYESAWKKIQQPKEHKMQIQHLPMLQLHMGSQSNRKLANNLQELLELDSEDDPYLRRFKRTSEQNESGDRMKETSGVIARMEKRMENVVKRIR